MQLAEPPFNLPSSSFRYNSVAIESDQYVCVKDVAADGSNQVVVIDLHHDNAITRRPTKKAEAALMHTKDNIIVLKGKSMLFVVLLARKFLCWGCYCCSCFRLFLSSIDNGHDKHDKHDLQTE